MMVKAKGVYMRFFNSMVCIILLVFLVNGCDNKTSQQLLQMAQDKITKNDLNSAVIDLKNAASQSPSDKDIRLELGRLYLLTSDFSEAEKELSKAKELGSTEEEIMPYLLKAIFYQNDFERVILRAKNISPVILENDSKVNLFIYLAKLKASEIEITFPLNSLLGDDLIIAQAYQSFTQGDVEQALQQIKTYQSPNSEVLEKSLLSGLLQAQQKNYTAAIIAFKEAVAVAPHYYAASFQLAEVLILANRQDEAQTVLQQLLDKNDNAAYPNYLMAQVFFSQEKFAEAFSHAEKASQNGISNPLSNLIAGISAYKIDRLESAYRYLNRIAEILPENHLGKRLFIEVKLRLGYTQEALDLIDGFNDIPAVMAPIYSEAAFQSYRLGNVETAKLFYEKSNNLAPNNPRNLLQEGILKLSDSDYSGIESLKKAIEQDTSIDEAWMLVTQGYVEMGKPDEALATAREWQNINKAKGLSLEAYIYLQLDMPEKAKPLLNQSLQLDNQLLSSKRFLMLLSAREKDYTQAQQYGESVVGASSDNLQYIVELLNIMIEAQKTEEFKQFMSSLIKQRGNEETIALNIGLALLYQHEGKLNQGITLLKSLEQFKDVRLYLTLGNLYLKNQQFKLAVNAYDEIIKQNNKVLTAWFQILETLTQAKQYAAALEKAKEVMQIFPDDPRFEIIATHLMLKNKLVTEAKNKISTLQKTESENPTMLLLQGELALLEKRFDSALKNLVEYDKNSPSFDVAVSIATAFEGLNRADEGAVYLENALVKLPLRFKETHYLAEYCSKNNLLEKAATLYESILVEYPNHFITLNNYANVLIRLNKLDEAFKISSKAQQLEPTSSYALDTIGWVLFKQGKVEDSLIYLQKASEGLPNNSEIKLHLIENYIALKQNQTARSLLKRLSPTSAAEKQQIEKLTSDIAGQ
tara:strand:- start:1147 stop:3915 length:2769 start_codon:yes stop_codon:yes gene_type:complete